MNILYHVVGATLLMSPTLALSQGQAERIGVKQKSWMAANFRSGLSSCATVSLQQGYAVTGTGVATFDDSNGDSLGFSIAAAASGVPTVTALAIKTKGTGAQRQRALDSVCEIKASADGGTSSISGPACAVSGDHSAPTISFVVPLTTWTSGATAKSYVGTVTIVKRAESAPAIDQYTSKKGYDYYRSRGVGTTGPVVMTVVAACDTSGLVSKGGKPVAHWDLAVNKKV